MGGGWLIAAAAAAVAAAAALSPAAFPCEASSLATAASTSAASSGSTSGSCAGAAASLAAGSSSNVPARGGRRREPNEPDALEPCVEEPLRRRDVPMSISPYRSSSSASAATASGSVGGASAEGCAGASASQIDHEPQSATLHGPRLSRSCSHTQNRPAHTGDTPRSPIWIVLVSQADLCEARCDAASPAGGCCATTHSAALRHAL